LPAPSKFASKHQRGSRDSRRDLINLESANETLRLLVGADGGSGSCWSALGVITTHRERGQPRPREEECSSEQQDRPHATAAGRQVNEGGAEGAQRSRPPIHPASSCFARLAGLDETVLRTRRASSARNRVGSTCAPSVQARSNRKMKPLSQPRKMEGICGLKSLQSSQRGPIENFVPKHKGHDPFLVRDLLRRSS
jgi:hypothetical protein